MSRTVRIDDEVAAELDRIADEIEAATGERPTRSGAIRWALTARGAMLLADLGGASAQEWMGELVERAIELSRAGLTGGDRDG